MNESEYLDSFLLSTFNFFSKDNVGRYIFFTVALEQSKAEGDINQIVALKSFSILIKNLPSYSPLRSLLLPENLFNLIIQAAKQNICNKNIDILIAALDLLTSYVLICDNISYANSAYYVNDENLFNLIIRAAEQNTCNKNIGIQIAVLNLFTVLVQKSYYWNYDKNKTFRLALKCINQNLDSLRLQSKKDIVVIKILDLLYILVQKLNECELHKKPILETVCLVTESFRHDENKFIRHAVCFLDAALNLQLTTSCSIQ